MLTRIGVWVWGSATVLLAFASLAIVVLGGLSIEVENCRESFKDAPAWLPGMYVSLEAHSNLVAGVLGFSGLAWAHFYSALSAPRSSA